MYHKAIGNMSDIFVRKISNSLFNECGELHPRRNRKSFSVKIFFFKKF